MSRKLRHGPEKRTHPLIWFAAIICTIIAVAVIITGVGVFIGYMVIHPRIPVIAVVDAHLDKIQSDIAGLLETQVTILIKAENDNSKAHASFSDTSFILSFQGIVIAKLVAEPFDVKKNDSVEFNYVVPSSSIPLSPDQMEEVDLALCKRVPRIPETKAKNSELHPCHQSRVFLGENSPILTHKTS